MLCQLGQNKDITFIRPFRVESPTVGLRENILVNIGTLHKTDQEYSQAVGCYESALSIAREIKDKRGESRTLVNLGNVLELMGNTQKALILFDQGLALMEELADRNGMAITPTSMGTVTAQQGKQRVAEAFLTRSLKFLDQTGNVQQKAATLSELAAVQREAGKFYEAKRNMEIALALKETLGEKYTNQDFQSRFFASAQDYYYGFHINQLMDLHKRFPRAGFNGSALEVSERARARALLDLLAEAGADIRQGVDPKLLEEERSLQKSINAKSTATMRGLRGADAAAALSEIEKLSATHRRSTDGKGPSLLGSVCVAR